MSKARSNVIKLNDILSVVDYGAVGDGSTDDTFAIQSAIEAVAANGGKVYFPRGLYKVTDELLVTSQFVTMIGDGPRASVLYVYHDTGYGVLAQNSSSPGTSYLNGFSMQNMGIRAMVDTTGNACLGLNKVQDVYLDNVTFYDHFGGVDVLGGLNQHWTNVTIKSARTASGPMWSAVKTGSYFLKCRKDGGGVGPSEVYITNFNFRRAETFDYVENGIVISACDGIWLNNGHVMGVDQADMRIEPVGGTEQITGIRCSNVWFDNNSTYGIYVTGTTTGQFGDIELTGSRFLTNETAGIYVHSSATGFAGFGVTGAVVHKSGVNGAYLAGGIQHRFSDCTFAACNTSATASSGGITLGAGVDNLVVSGCEFVETQATTTATSMQGVTIPSGATSQVIVSGCRFDLTGTDISDASTADDCIYPNNITTKTQAAYGVTSSTLNISQIGNIFSVADGLSFNNVDGRQYGRVITLDFQGASTVTHGSGLIELNGSANFSATAGDTLTLVYSQARDSWIEIGRMVA